MNRYENYRAMISGEILLKRFQLLTWSKGSRLSSTGSKIQNRPVYLVVRTTPLIEKLQITVSPFHSPGYYKLRTSTWRESSLSWASCVRR